MKFKEADLVRALECLNADPATDAALVLEAIPPVPPASKPLWPIITMATIGGAATSALLIWMLMPGHAPDEERDGEEDDPPAIEEREELLPRELEELLPPREVSSDLALEMSIGEINLLSARSSAPLSAGQHLAYGQTYRTSDEAIVQIALTGESQARIGPRTRLIFENERSINLIRGLLWLQNANDRGALYVVTSEGDIEAEPGSVISLVAHDEEVQLATLMGNASFDTIASGRLRLGDSQFCQSTGGLVEDPRDAEPAWYFVRWQVPLLTRYDRQEEIVNVLAGLSFDLGIPERREIASSEFRRLGSLSPRALTLALDGLVNEEELRRKHKNHDERIDNAEEP